MTRRPVELEDILRSYLVGEAEIAPDGARVAFTVKRVDTEKNRYLTALWMTDTASGNARAFTGGDHSDGSPRWSPDGTTLAFTSDRDKGKGQVWLIDTAGGEARPLTRLDEGAVQGIAWSPDGSRIAFLRRATPEAWTEKAKKEREEKGLSAPVRVHRRLFYRLDGFGYVDNCYWQIWVADVATGDACQVTRGDFHHGAPAWSPDGTTLAYIADPREDADAGGRPLPEVFTLMVEGGPGEPRRVEAPAGPKSSVQWSPDGLWLAYVGHADPDDDWGGLNDRVLVLPANGATEARDLTGHTDKTVGWETLSDWHEVGGRPLVWSHDSSALYFPISARGDTRLARARIEDGEIEFLTPERREMGAFSVSANGEVIAVTLSSATELHDVYVGAPAAGGTGLRRVSDANPALAAVELQMPDALDLPNGDGGTVHTWLLRPTGFDPAAKYPCVVYVHGGPAMQYGGEAAPFHELQWLAANGYVVIFSNPRGSKGYGEAHTRAIEGDWGNRDWDDVQAVADHAASLPYVDAARMAIMGGSYGGFMTAWAVGHTHRFACAITDRLVGNLHSFTGTVDFPFRHGHNWKGNAWDDPSDLWRCSPLAYAGRVTTPLLIVHSDGDLRCPIEQAEQLFAALRHRGCEVEMARYPAESSHGLSRGGPPDLRLDRLRRNLAWLDAHLKR